MGDGSPIDRSFAREYHPRESVHTPFFREVMPVRKLDLDSMKWDIPPPLVPARHAHHLSRRAFMGSMAAAAGATVGAGLLPATVLAGKPSSDLTPKPTATVTNVFGVDFHVTFFGPGVDPSSIGDFNGFVGVADVQGTGTGTNPDGSTETLLFDTDMRFMSGVYVGVDGAVHKGAFGFV
jgi:hypothetical protein